MVAMVRDNQSRIEESNVAMLDMVRRQEREMREREEVWDTQVTQLREMLNI